MANSEPRDMVNFQPWMGVFETFACGERSVPLFVPEHRTELQRAMDALGLRSNFDFPGAASKLPQESGRWRWLVNSGGSETIFTPEVEAPHEPVRLGLSSMRVGSQNWDARFKTVSHLTHMCRRCRLHRTAEALLLNENRDIACTARANIFLLRDGQLYTPSPESGCRCGVIRAFVLQRRKVREETLAFDCLRDSDEVFLTNSMRGIVSVSACHGRTWERFPYADALRTEYAQADCGADAVVAAVYDRRRMNRSEIYTSRARWS